MSIFKKLLSKIHSGFFYVVDLETFKEYLEKELNFCLENHLEASADLYVYLLGEKHHIQIWNYGASRWNEDKEKGLIIYYDQEEYKSLIELYDSHFKDTPTYFKIELIEFDNVFLNQYKKELPELKIEDY